MESVLEAIGCNADPAIQTCSVTIKKVNGVDVSAGMTLRRRHLQGTTLLVEYEFLIEALCSGGCDDGTSVQTVANQVYTSLTGELKYAIDNGDFADALKATSLEVSTLLAAATVTGDFSAVDVPLLSLISDWFPDWSGDSYTCLNDLDRAPFYMKVNTDYFEDSLDACCKRYFPWAYSECTGDSGTVPDRYFPNWDGNECMQVDDLLPEYMRNNPDQWLVTTIESCCKRYFAWSYSECLAESSGVAITGSLDWYVQGEVCKQDCAEDGGTCGGFAQPWNQLYISASSLCEARSTNSAVVGSQKWFVDWSINKCVKDCGDEAQDPS
ncbi:hypothetical protein THAOC_11498, partial [Thalassiosira oceanica]